ncbi:MAG: pyridoxal 5'-phosphate synthase glutaminase subunit PdxT [Eggerthellaceae bacterium]|jgi:5'-phosphate synthase pdxT subunit|nr:pyridoxal 5'-phosphate synthase glutaminase subunit PdxT [Eggerthellaceae bacterium]MCH4220352.1 pyridoxal 5'-phosphate synthase glutaminase subunit PdxT [Eggerthellaceae bacterium]
MSFLSKTSVDGAPRIGVLAVQGAFIEHEQRLSALGAHCVELRQARDCAQPLDGLILPGGESTVQGKLIRELGMYEQLRRCIDNDVPVLGTCAGMILLAQHLVGDEQTHLASMPITVERNAYGRQLDSFHTTAVFDSCGTVPMTFIRAPKVVSVADDVRILARVDDAIVGAQYRNQIALSFHPELDNDMTIHRSFFEMVQQIHATKVMA